MGTPLETRYVLVAEFEVASGLTGVERNFRAMNETAAQDSYSVDHADTYISLGRGALRVSLLA